MAAVMGWGGGGAWHHPLCCRWAGFCSVVVMGRAWIRVTPSRPKYTSPSPPTSDHSLYGIAAVGSIWLGRYGDYRVLPLHAWCWSGDGRSGKRRGTFE